MHRSVLPIYSSSFLAGITAVTLRRLFFIEYDIVFAKDSIQKQLDQASRREGVGLLDILGGGGSAAAFAAGRPEIGAAIAVPTILRRIMQQPQVKSQAANIANKTPQGVLPEFLRKILQIQGGQGATSF